MSLNRKLLMLDGIRGSSAEKKKMTVTVRNRLVDTAVKKWHELRDEFNGRKSQRDNAKASVEKLSKAA